MGTSARSLYRHLCKDLLPLRKAGYTLHARFYSLGKAADTASPISFVEQPRRTDVQQRIRELQDVGMEAYPSVLADTRSVTCRDFRQRYSTLKPGETREGESVVLRGMSNRLSWFILIANAVRKGIFI